MPFESHLSGIAHVIQLAVAPVFLLTGIGTIINALNARLSRIVDRRRVLEDHLTGLAPDIPQPVSDELHSLARRLRLAYASILLAVTSALLICILVASAFVSAFIDFDLARVVATFFVLAMLALIACLILLLREVFLAVTTGRHPFK
jgi:hypothetical protein